MTDFVTPDVGTGTQRSRRTIHDVTVDDFEWTAELERLLTGGVRPGRWAFRVRYRQRTTTGRRSSQRWRAFLLMYDDQRYTFDEIAERIELAIVEHFRRGAGIVAGT